jgi:hypothetical protein
MFTEVTIMKLDFKGLITKDALEKDINNLNNIIKDYGYAIIVENGVGKYVVFDIDFVENEILLKDDISKIRSYKKSPYTLVEAMIKTLEEIPEKKTTAIMLSSLVLDYYGKKATPVIIRTRAEENANGKGDIDYFIIEPGNIIGLSKDSSYDLYMFNKFKRAMEFELIKLFKDKKIIVLSDFLNKAHLILQSLAFQKYTKQFSDEDIKKIIASFEKYKIDNNLLILL